MTTQTENITQVRRNADGSMNLHDLRRWSRETGNTVSPVGHGWESCSAPDSDGTCHVEPLHYSIVTERDALTAIYTRWREVRGMYRGV